MPKKSSRKKSTARKTSGGQAGRSSSGDKRKSGGQAGRSSSGDKRKSGGQAERSSSGDKRKSGARKDERKPSHRIPTPKQRSAASAAKKRPPRSSILKDDVPTDSKIRLQRILASAGFGSRRACEELITEGRVDVDREVVTELGVKVDPFTQTVRVDGQPLQKQKKVYLAVYKPKGVICTNSDPTGRPRAVDLVPENLGRLYPVGRLDVTSEGLLILTNDGELTNRLTHPRYRVQKVYRVHVAGLMQKETVSQLNKGIYLAEGFAKVSGVTIKARHKQSTVLEMTLEEGKNREIRRVLARVGHKVMSLTRTAIGPVRLGKLTPGEYRRLSGAELSALRNPKK